MEWIEWTGGKCPVDGKTKVQVRFRVADGSDEGSPAYALRWTHTDSWGDIIAYRIIEQQPDTPSIEPAATAVQVGGDHYKKLGIQPIEYISANNLGFCEGNVVKYVSRWKDKNGLQDLEKAKHYIELLIEMEKKYGRR